MNSHARSYIYALFSSSLLLAGCGTQEPVAEEGFETICYRGQVVLAERRGDTLIVDFDLEATPVEQWCNENQRRELLAAALSSGPGLETQGRRAPAEEGDVWGSSTYGDQWDGGVVPYVIDSSFSNTEQDAIIAAMEHWESHVPGIHFRAKTGADASWIEFEHHSSDCQSGYGRIPGKRRIKLRSGCTTNFSVHHEIGHALGLQHEHTRSDRDDYVNVSSSADNYAIDDGADMFSYDFDSVMHYALGGTISVKAGVTVPAGVTVGHLDHLSYLDVMTMNAMYPVAHLHSPLFRNTGTQKLCHLDGREQDIVTAFETDSSVAALENGATASTNSLAVGDYTVTCVARSLFWSRDYAYPNPSAYDEEIDSSNLAETQAYTASRTVRVLDQGLLAAMF